MLASAPPPGCGGQNGSACRSEKENCAGNGSFGAEAVNEEPAKGGARSGAGIRAREEESVAEFRSIARSIADEVLAVVAREPRQNAEDRNGGRHAEAVAAEEPEEPE